MIYHSKYRDDDPNFLITHTYSFKQKEYDELSAKYAHLNDIPELNSGNYLGTIDFNKFHYLQMQMIAQIGGQSKFSQAATDDIFDCVGVD